MKKTGFFNLKLLLPLCIGFVFVLGTVSFYIGGERLADAMYYSFSLFSMNLNSDVMNIGVEVSRWAAPLLTLASLAAIIQNIYIRISNAYILKKKGSVVIYGDSDAVKTFSENVDYAVIAEDEVVHGGNRHMIMFKKDEDSINFYKNNEEFFKSKEAYICFNDIEPNMLPNDFKINHFNANDVIANSLWFEEIKLWDNKVSEINIAILGFSSLGERILYKGFLLNLIDPKQKITYHVFGDTVEYQLAHDDLNTMNADKIVFHSYDDNEKWNIIQDADYIIVADLSNIKQLQNMMYINKKGQVYYYSPNGSGTAEIISDKRLHGFGSLREVYTGDNIFRDKVYSDAKKLHFEYMKKQHPEKKYTEQDCEALWMDLDGFSKDSNVSSAYYSYVMKYLYLKYNMSDEELARLEHIRWCRFHFINHWSYGEGDSPGDSPGDYYMDPVRRIHSVLRDFDDLDVKTQNKDFTNVRVMKSNLEKIHGNES